MIDTLYYGDNHHHKIENASFEFSTDVLATFLRRIYNGFDTSNDFEPTMWREILRIINEATVEGLTQSTFDVSHERKFLESLAHSNEVFSAFKVHDMGVDMAKKLKTSDGKLKSFAEWKKDVAPIATHYCGSWLQTEYNTAVLRGHFAAEWKQYEADKDIMPNLRWMPTTSATPDEEHKAYWMNRLTLPVGDKFWNNHHPGDHWNCKCTLEQTDDPINPEVLDGVKDVKAQPGLKTNPGKSGVMYDKSHPYFAESCAKCPFYGKKGLKNVFSNVEKHCENCESIDDKLGKVNNDGYLVKNKYPNGGELLIHEGVDKKKSDYHAIVNICNSFAKDGHVVKVTPIVHYKSHEYQSIYSSLIGTKYEKKCPDFCVDGKFYEYESYVRPWNKKKVSHMLSDGLKQSSRVILDNTRGCSDRFYRRNIIARQHLPNQQIDEVWLYEKGEIRLFYKDGKFYKNNKGA